MRTLLLLRGSAGCGKSTWIEENKLKNYAISADEIRILCGGSVQNKNGKQCISMENDAVVWRILFSILETRMQHGDFTVIDATNSKTIEMNRYKELCDQYRYRIFCVDFTDIPIEEVKRRNAGRDPLKQVPDEVIDKMYSRFRTQKIPSGIKVIKPDELDKIWFKPIDLSMYKKIHHIGDIHGCNTALQEYMNRIGRIKDDEFYVFTGDFIDRGIENAEVVKYLLSISDKKNVILLEGNHEQWLRNYGNGVPTHSKEFEQHTYLELENGQIDKKDLRVMCRKFCQCAYYTYDGKTVFVSHGGVASLPDNLTFLSTKQMVKGVGDYKDAEQVDDAFLNGTPDNYYQIHGHRNVKGVPAQANDRCFNLEGRVEFGGNLRIVTLSCEGFETIEIKNNVFKLPKETEETENKTEKELTGGEILSILRCDKYITEKKFGDISSFNFTKEAFFDKVWNEQTIKARGLYLNTETGKVVARAYPKFFNVNERPETKFENLRYKLKFPVTAYVKENGFLGIISYNAETDDLFITTKSDPTGEYAQWLTDIFESKTSEETRSQLKEFVKNNDVSMVFECVDMKNDPHIIEYPENELFLLDVVKNDIEFSKYPYELTCKIAARFGLDCKTKGFVLNNWQDFFDWYYKILEPDYEYGDRGVIEGFVIEDSNGFMTKLKLNYYNFWKFMRGISGEVLKKGYSSRTSAFTTPEANDFYGWVKGVYEQNKENLDIVPKNICTLRSLFNKEYKH